MKVELHTIAIVQVEVDDKFKKLKCSDEEWSPKFDDLAAELEDILSKATDTSPNYFCGIFDAEDDMVMLEY